MNLYCIKLSFIVQHSIIGECFLFQELAKLLENQHGYIDLQNIPENKYYSMTQAENEEEKI